MRQSDTTLAEAGKGTIGLVAVSFAGVDVVAALIGGYRRCSAYHVGEAFHRLLADSG